MQKQAPGIIGPTLVPALLTLLVTVARLVGELQGWGMPWVDAQGGQPAIVGIAWLVLIFGFWFGFRFARAGFRPRNAALSALVFLVGAIGLFGGIQALMAADLVFVPTAETPGEPTGMPYIVALAAVATLVGFLAWPRVAATLFVYGLLARIPVIAVIFIAERAGWQTHYTRLSPGFPDVEGLERVVALGVPQLVMWLPITVLVGGVCACIGAASAGGRGDRRAHAA